MRLLVIGIVVTASLSVGRAGAVFDPASASFAISFHDEISAYRDASAVLLPGAAIEIKATNGPPRDYEASTKDGTLVQQGLRQWRWTAPGRPGTYQIEIHGPGEHDTINLHALVMVPAAEVKDGLLNGYRIGTYPPAPKNKSTYRPPAGFIEVTKDNQDTKVSPHFALKQFLCKEDPSKRFPKYLAIEERLPLELEAVLERVNVMGFPVDTLHVMSGFRTPYYNAAIGDVEYSMHQWGGAADIYVDPSKQDRMADLNRDGRVDVDDARTLYDEIEQMLAAGDRARFRGGMGFYPATNTHPPFVHVDVRGSTARWQGQ